MPRTGRQATVSGQPWREAASILLIDRSERPGHDQTIRETGKLILVMLPADGLVGGDSATIADAT